MDRFFLICKRTEQLDLIKIEDVSSKCVLVHNHDEYFISIFNENDEIIASPSYNISHDNILEVFLLRIDNKNNNNKQSEKIKNFK